MTDPLIGATTAVFTIGLSVALAEPVDVAWSTKDGVAKAGVDYQAASGVVTFLPGETEKTIQVTVYGQGVGATTPKNFYIVLSPPTNAILNTPFVECVITVEDDEGTPITSLIVAQGKRGLKGDPGLSAYDQAVIMGYEGSVEQWMEDIADASQAAVRAQEATVETEVNAARAEAAAAAAAFSGRIYPTPSAGVDPVTGVPNGAYFNVRSESSDSFIDEYQNIGGVATPTGKSYPATEYVQSVADYTALPFVDGKAYAINQRVQLDSGDIVRSTVNDNEIDPNTSLTGWVKINSASQVFDEEGENQQQINNKFKKSRKTIADPRDFGAPNNGTSDDAAGVRAAIAYLTELGGGTLFMDSNIAWQFNTLHSNGLDAVFIGLSNIRIDFGTCMTRVDAGIAMRAMFKLSDSYTNNIDISGGRLYGNNLAQYGLYGDPTTFNPFMQINGFEARGFTEAAASMNPYMTVISRSNFSFSKKGLVLNNKGTVAEITSTTLIGVYANGCTEKGIEVNNRMMYANIISCGVDDCGGIAYDLALQSANILGCGAEHALKLAKFNINDGVVINGLTGIGIGSLDSGAPSDAAVEVAGSGFDAIQFSGVRLLNHPTQTRYRNKDLKVVSASGIYPKVIVHDRSFLKQNTEITGTTSVYGNVVEFRENHIRNNDTITIPPSDLKSNFDLINNTTNEFTYTIQLNNGTETLDKLLQDVKGNGTLIIQGNASDRTLVRLKGARLGFLLKNCICRIVLRNLTIENQYTVSDNSIAQIDVDNCRSVTLDNVLFDAPSFAVGCAVRARNGSHVTLMNGTTCGLNHTTGAAYEIFSGSKIDIQAVTAPPTGRWAFGMRVNNADPSVNGIIEWIYVRNTGTSTNEWKAIT